MIVCIAEKPSVAKDIANVIGANKANVNRGIGYYEGNGYVVTWTFGHLCTLKEPHDYNPLLQKWDLSTLPIIPQTFGIKAIDIPNYISQLDVIKGLLSNATMVVNCGDAGQEGEVIQRWVLQYSKCNCPVRRLWVSSLTTEAIIEGFGNLKDSTDYDTLYYAGLSRAVGDWLLGINATRLYTLKYGETGKGVLSIGRVQTPTLSLIVERDREIENFVSTPYWEIKTRYRDVVFSSSKGRFDDKNKAYKLLEKISTSDMIITEVTKKNGKELPPKLFDLTSLQVMCNKKFSMSAEETLQTAQSLYEKKIITYPRVDTTFLSNDIYPKIPKILGGLITYREYTQFILSQKNIIKRKKVFDDTKVTDHHAIIPTGQALPHLTEREHKVFDIIVKYFIASFYPDCDYSSTNVTGKAENVIFKASGKEIINKGWRLIFDGIEIDENTDNDDNISKVILPEFVKGESGTHIPEVIEKHTQPPKHYTEATLLRAMETAGKFVDNEELRDALKDNGIGRPSTRSNIIETLHKRGYIEKKKRNILSTQHGKNLIDKIDFDVLKSASLTGLWEKKLRMIEKKEMQPQQFIGELKNMVKNLVLDVITQAKKNYCPKCGEGYMIRGNRAWGCSAFKNGCDFIIPFSLCPPDSDYGGVKNIIKSGRYKIEKQNKTNKNTIFDNDIFKDI